MKLMLGGQEQETFIQTHVIERYKERLNKDHLPNHRAVEEIKALLGLAVLSKEAPEWLNEPPSESVDARKRAHESVYAVIEDSIVFPAYIESTGEIRIVSCIAKGGISSYARKRRNKKRQHRQTTKGAGLRRWRGV